MIKEVACEPCGLHLVRVIVNATYFSPACRYHKFFVCFPMGVTHHSAVFSMSLTDNGFVALCCCTSMSLLFTFLFDGSKFLELTRSSCIFPVRILIIYFSGKMPGLRESFGSLSSRAFDALKAELKAHISQPDALSEDSEVEHFYQNRLLEERHRHISRRRRLSELYDDRKYKKNADRARGAKSRERRTLLKQSQTVKSSTTHEGRLVLDRSSSHPLSREPAGFGEKNCNSAAYISKASKSKRAEYHLTNVDANDFADDYRGLLEPIRWTDSEGVYFSRNLLPPLC